MDQKVIEYMRGLVGKTVLHTEYGVVGEVAKLYEPGEYVDGGGNVIGRHVLELDNGNAFVMPDDTTTIVQLTEREALIFMKFSHDLGVMLVGVMATLRSQSAERMVIGLALIRSALAAQLRALDS